MVTTEKPRFGAIVAIFPIRVFSDWCKDQAAKIPQFKFWNMTRKFELLILILVRTFQQSDFRLYTAALMAITPLMFALDRTNYARWLPIHIRDMGELPTKQPHVYKEFISDGRQLMPFLLCHWIRLTNRTS